VHQNNRRSQSKDAVDKKVFEIAKEILNNDPNEKKGQVKHNFK